VADFRQNRREEFAVGFREALAEEPRRYANEQVAALLRLFLPGGAKPREKAMRINTPLGMLEDLVPKSHQKNQPLTSFSTHVENLWKSTPLRGGNVVVWPIGFLR